MTSKQPNSPVNSSLDSNQDIQGVHSRKATANEVAYRDGYVEGQSTERSQAARDQYTREQLAREQYAREQIRESNGVANGMIIGLSLAALAGLVAGAIYFVNRDQSPAPQQRNTTIIERTIDRTRETAPQAPDVQAPNIQLPDVQINVPQPAAPTQPSESTNSAPNQAPNQVPSQPEASGSANPLGGQPSDSAANGTTGEN